MHSQAGQFSALVDNEKQQAIVLTSNKAFSEWATVFAADAVMASAALDRLLHHATVINIRGESHRMKTRQRAGSVEGRIEPPIEQTHGAKPTPGQTRRSRGRAAPAAEQEEVSA